MLGLHAARHEHGRAYFPASHSRSYIIYSEQCVSRAPLEGVLPGRSRVEAATWHSASLTPAGALSCCIRPSLPLRLSAYVCVCVRAYRAADEEIRCVRACVRVSLRPAAQQKLAYRTSSRELSQEGREPRPPPPPPALLRSTK